MRWLQRYEHHDCTCKVLSSPNCAEEHIPLDRKLAHALSVIFMGEPKRSLAVQKEAFAVQGRSVSGRHTL